MRDTPGRELRLHERTFSGELTASGIESIVHKIEVFSENIGNVVKIHKNYLKNP